VSVPEGVFSSINEDLIDWLIIVFPIMSAEIIVKGA